MKKKEKVKISLAMMKGKVEPMAARILLPFLTNQSKFSKEIPRRATLIFEGIKNDRGKLEYRFIGVDAKCYCEECFRAEKTKKV